MCGTPVSIQTLQTSALMLDRSGTTKLMEDGHESLNQNRLLLLCQSSAKLSMYSQGMLMFSHWSVVLLCTRTVGETSKAMLLRLSGAVRELPRRQVEHLQASGRAGKDVLLDSLLVPGALWPLDSQGYLDTARSLLKSEVLDLVLYVELQNTGEESRSEFRCAVFLFFCWYGENQRRKFDLSYDD